METDEAMQIVDIDPDNARFEKWAQVFVVAGEEAWGRNHHAHSVGEHRAFWVTNDRARRGVAVDVDGTLVAAARLSFCRRDNPHLVTLEIDAMPGTNRATVSMLLRAVEDRVRAGGRTTIFAETMTPLDREAQTWGPDASACIVQQALSDDGYVVAQTVAISAQQHPVDRDTRQRAEAALAIDDDYVIESTVGELPERWLADRARLGALMSRDTPLGDLDLRPETVDVERVVAQTTSAIDAGRTVITTMALHRPSGVRAGFSLVEIAADRPWIAEQDDTIVESAHRGHRLGVRLKAATALLVDEVAPEVTVQRTFNDETNTPMLAVNTELGYERIGTMKEWQRVLTDRAQP